MTVVRNAVYLSGWEYNRLLQEDPLVSRGSSLPTEILSNGAHIFWLFEKVYCAQESLDNELWGAESLGWASGRIFEELVKEKCLEPIDWDERLSQSAKARLRRKHAQLQSEIQPDVLRNLVEMNDTRCLESVKLRLLEPVADELGCENFVGPNSLSLWSHPTESDAPSLLSVLDSIAAPFAASALGRGIQMCERPGQSLSSVTTARLREVQLTVEKPMITALYLGETGFEGRHGYKNFYNALEPHADLYREVNTPVWASWERNRDDLMRLREAASKYIWPKLHGEWLPRLAKEPNFASEFTTLVDSALKLAPIAKHLEMSTGWAIATGAAAAALVLCLSGSYDSALTWGSSAGGATKVTMERAKAGMTSQYGGLPLFYSETIAKR